jgi:hypothetical protein
MSGEVECVTLGLAIVEFLPEIHISHLITCKKYDEKITTNGPKVFDSNLDRYVL